MIHYSLLFRFNSFPIIGFTHLYCRPVGCAGCLVTRRERINTENRVIKQVPDLIDLRQIFKETAGGRGCFLASEIKSHLRFEISDSSIRNNFDN